jgi:hypothetical protein
MNGLSKSGAITNGSALFAGREAIDHPELIVN